MCEFARTHTHAHTELLGSAVRKLRQSVDRNDNEFISTLNVERASCKPSQSRARANKPNQSRYTI